MLEFGHADGVGHVGLLAKIAGPKSFLLLVVPHGCSRVPFVPVRRRFVPLKRRFVPFAPNVVRALGRGGLGETVGRSS